jgi:hypothetical protein
MGFPGILAGLRRRQRHQRLEIFPIGLRLPNDNGPARPVAECSRRHLPAGGTADAIAIDEEIAARVGWIGKLDVRHALSCGQLNSGG